MQNQSITLTTREVPRRRTSMSAMQMYLNQHRVKRKQTHGAKMPFTHTSISRPHGTYNLPQEEEDHQKFFDLYYQHVFEQKLPSYLVEGILDGVEFTPVRIDLDFRMYQDTSVPLRIYDLDGEVVAFCQEYMKVMEEYFHDLEDEERLCVIMEKPEASFATQTVRRNGQQHKIIKTNSQGEKFIKDGVHIMFPNLYHKKFLQLKFRELVCKNFADKFQKFKYENAITDIVDEAVISKNGWQLYGSKKSPDSLTYKATKFLKVFPTRIEELSLEDLSEEFVEDYLEKNYDNPDAVSVDERFLLQNRYLVELLSVRNKDDCVGTAINIEKDEEVLELEKKHNDIVRINKECLNRGSNDVSPTDISDNEFHLLFGEKMEKIEATDRLDEHGNVRIVKHDGYLGCLSMKRVKNYHDWIRVGWALYNISNTRKYKGSANAELRGKPEMLYRWFKWSTRPGSGYEHMWPHCIGEYEKYWDQFRPGKLGIGSLKMWAKNDALEKHRREGKHPHDLTDYEIVRGYDLRTFLLNCVKDQDITELPVALVLKKLYGDIFVYEQVNKSGEWYYFNEKKHRWIRDASGLTFKNKFHQAATHFSTLAKKMRDENGEFGNEKTSTGLRLQQISTKLGSTRFVNSLLNMCQHHFFNESGEKFVEKLDSNRSLIGFENGVFDLDENQFRPGRPDDYISKSVGYDYKELVPNSKIEKDIRKFFSQILPNQAVREYNYDFMAQLVSGNTNTEKFHIWAGCGGNGKSKIIELLNEILGEYSVNCNVTMLTGDRPGSAQANPELAKCKGARLVVMQEPDQKTAKTGLNVGFMKELTGGDRISTRQLYSETFQFYPQFKLIYCCNVKPKLPPDDGGTWRRIVLVRFNSRFVEESTARGAYEEREDENGDITLEWVPEPIDHPEYPIDEQLKNSFPKWKQTFMSMMIQRFLENKKNGKPLKQPNEVLEYTLQYKAEQDSFIEFFTDCIVDAKTILPPDYEEDGVEYNFETCPVKTVDEINQRYRIHYKQTMGHQKDQKKKSELKKYLEGRLGPEDEERLPNGRKRKGYRVYFINDMDEQDDDGSNLDFT